MRQWDEAGNVRPSRWEAPGPLLARADGVVLSEEDVGGDQRLLAEYATQTRLLVVTDGVRGCMVYEHGRARRFSAPAVDEVDPTGAGDIFAAAFFVALQRVGDAWTAARFANCVAARSVTRAGLKSTPTQDEIARCERALRVSVRERPGEV
jgi:sugar/nucleoside kinase (ribokinase family)